MWLNEYKEVLVQDIDRFEQEMVIAIHRIPAATWMSSMEELMANIPDPLLPMMYGKITSFVELLQELFISTDIAPEFAAYLIQGSIDQGKPFSISDIRDYTSRIRGLSATNKDLSIVKFKLNVDYYKRGNELFRT